MAMTAMGIDIMLPAFPDIREEFGMAADSTQVTWILTAFFLGMAVGPWVFGPASDRFGRKPMMIAGLVMYMAAAAAATLGPDVGVARRVTVRVGSSRAGGPRTLSVAMVRDRFEGDAMARLMSTIMAIFPVGADPGSECRCGPDRRVPVAGRVRVPRPHGPCCCSCGRVGCPETLPVRQAPSVHRGGSGRARLAARS
jgi:hypothetical protein